MHRAEAEQIAVELAVRYWPLEPPGCRKSSRLPRRLPLVTFWFRGLEYKPRLVTIAGCGSHARSAVTVGFGARDLLRSGTP